ncbi:MAG: NosD domain-containing protein, partial [Gemmatimonas sp.]
MKLAALSLTLVATALVAPTLSAQGEVGTVLPRAGMVITSSVRIRPGIYRLSVRDGRAVITVRGSNVSIDLRGVTFEGSPAGSDPDLASGVALRIEGGADVRVTGLRARGYRTGIHARQTRGLTLVGNDLSHGWKPRLFSVVEHESLNDWLSYHKNHDNEWERFGTGIYLDRVVGGTLRANVVEQGMNGLLMTRTDSLDIRGNDLSFNSGLGIGMYRSSGNRIVGNRIDYNVRGYSHGFFRRGQDSAGILMFDGCNNNVVAYNSVTHGGDGLFLWAGQRTMDTGTGGA